VLPFVEQMVELDDPEKEVTLDRDDVFVFGSLKMARIAGKYGWRPGSLMTPNHDFNVYKEHYRENLLNWDSRVVRFADDFDTSRPFFARPCKDTKVFAGKVFDAETWVEFRDGALNNGHSTTLDRDTEVQISTVKRIQKEFRLWVVDGEVVTGSLYKLGNTPLTSEVIDEGALEFARRMIDVFQLAPAFIMDVCLADDEWKIVECGCVNCAGFYKADMSKALMAIEELYSNGRQI